MSTDRPTAGGDTVTEEGLQIWSCVTCRRRKVKCDRRNPCSNCVRHQIECHFPVTGRLPRRRDLTTWKSPTEKQAELLSRLRRLESLVTELAAQVEDGPDKVQSILPGLLPRVAGVSRSPETETTNPEIGNRELPNQRFPMQFRELVSAMDFYYESEINEDFGELVVGNKTGVQIGKGFWSVFCSEVEHIFEAIQDVASTASSSNYEPTTSSDQITSHNEFYFGNNYVGVFSQNMDDLYPLPSQMLFIWRIYVENVDPFIKVIDVAALEEVVTSLRGKFGSLPQSLQALLFTVCLASVTSLDDEETLSCFNTSRNQLLGRFRLGTERALANARLLLTKEIETIQAFVIYLSVLPHIGCQKLLSPFMGILLRIATSLQLHRDAESFKTPTLTPSEIEIRRRLWWQIIFIDSTSRLGHNAGLAASDTKFDTKAPSGVLPDDGKSSSASLRVESKSLVCILRYEIWTLCRFLNANQQKPLEHKLKAFDGLEHTIYLQHFHTLKKLLKTPSKEMVQHHLELSINILREAHKLRTEPSWRRWKWQLQGDFPWASMSAVFIQLCQSPWSTTSEKGWALTSQILQEAPDRIKANPSWGRLSQLITAAEAKRKRNFGQAMNQRVSYDEICVNDLVGTHEGGKEPLELLKAESLSTDTRIGYSESSSILMPSLFDFGVKLDDLNELESGVTFDPMEWQVWDEALIDDDQLWDPDNLF
ncbi:hypothetical protein ACQKWADRAFT_324739 [Trichoderma austrokoningii]